MSDNPLLAFAIGSLAASRGANELAHLSASIMVPRPVRRSAPGPDLSVLIEALQEQEQHIVGQNHAIEKLRGNNAAWQDYGTKLEREHDKLREWAEWADLELKKYQNKG